MGSTNAGIVETVYCNCPGTMFEGSKNTFGEMVLCYLHLPIS